MTGSHGWEKSRFVKKSIVRSRRGLYVLKSIKSVRIVARAAVRTRVMSECLHVRVCCHVSGHVQHTGQFGVELVPQ